MTRGDFPGLGFDPTPGELGAVAAVLDSLQNAAQLIEEVTPRLADAVTVTDDADWGGSAAEEFSDHADDLPQGFNTGMIAMSAVGEALATWFGQMTRNQLLADELEKKAHELRQELAAAAKATREEVTGDLDAVIDRAVRLEAKHEREANSAAAAIRGAQDDDPFKPEEDGFTQQALDGIAVVSGEIAKWTAAAATVAAFVPGGQGVAAGLATASAAAQLVNVSSMIGQKAAGSANAPSWGQVALAAVPAKAGSSAAKGALGGYKAARGQGAREVTESVARRGADGLYKGFTRNNAVAQARKGLDDVQSARRGEAVQHTQRTSGKDVAGTVAKAPLDAVDTANNLADEDNKRELNPWVKRANAALGVPFGGSVFDAGADIGKDLTNDAAKPGDPDPSDDWRK